MKKSNLCVLIVLMGLLLIGCVPKEQEMKIMSDELKIDANLVFFYYQDLDKAERFYSDVLGMEKVLDYGFAKIHRLSQSSYLCLVDVTKGMHEASEPKTVTLSFVTDEIDAWYDYLKAEGLTMRGPLGDATRHPTRGFVTYDPEGYFLEFERFLDHPQNTDLHQSLKNVMAVYPQAGQETSRPAELGIKANVLWLYYRDIPSAQGFYEDNFGAQLLVDQGFAKVYSSSASAFIGLVDEAQGLHRFTEKKAVNVAFITAEIEQWFAAFTRDNLNFKDQLEDQSDFPVRTFVLYDPGGYFLEFDHFIEDEKNRKLRSYLNY